MNESLPSVIAGYTNVPHPSSELGVLPTSDSLVPTSVTDLKVLGHGRAAEARLVRATEAEGNSFLCVEKVFSPGWLTRIIYRAAFQAPFAYRDNADAILASFYRRRVAASIIATMTPTAQVARPLYARWDDRSQAMVLASEYIRGRGIVPAPTDAWMLRRRLVRYFRGYESINPAPQEEISELLTLMTRVEKLLVDSGLTGSGWQVCKRAMVSTANLLRTEQGYVVVDLESGIPSVLVPSYVWAGFRLGSFPLFDDLDADKLQRWLQYHRGRLLASLGERGFAQLQDDAARLIRHTADWKLSEPAIGRQPLRLVTRDFRRRFKQRLLASWQRRDIVDGAAASSLREGNPRLAVAVFLLGLLPGAFGRCLQRLIANGAFRWQVRRWIADAEHRSQVLDQFAQRKLAQWRSERRILAGRPAGTFGATFVGHYLLSKSTPARMHRTVVDREYRRNQRLRVLLLCVSGSFQGEFGRLLIRSRIEHWRTSQRLSHPESDALTRQLGSSAVDEYVRCFGLHLGLKLLLPVVMSLKVGGAAASMASGNPFYFLFTLMLLPILRTAVTVWRIIATGRPLAEYRDALVVGMIPMLGSLAYPAQMYARFPVLSQFLLRDFAARVGCWLPIYGGKDSRVELAAIRSVNLAVEALECWLKLTGSQRSSGVAPVEPALCTAAHPLKLDRWSRLALTQLNMLRDEVGLRSTDGTFQPVAERDEANSPAAQRRAA